MSSDHTSTRNGAGLETLRRLLVVLWKGRRDWAADGHWLSVALPLSLPASIAQARIGRDKIGSVCDVSEMAGQLITYRIRRGRPGSSAEGDENAHLHQGRIAIVRHRWAADAPLPESLLAAWSKAITHPTS